MHYYTGLTANNVRNWIKDNQMFMDAYHAAERDKELKAEVKQLEKKYIRQHLIELVGEDEADRIMTEKGF